MNDSAETQTPAPPESSWETTFSDGGLPPAQTPQSDAEQTAAPPQTQEDIAANDQRLDEQARDKEGRFTRQGRHRRQKDMATAADVPRIQELTRKLREKEREFEEYKAKSAPVQPSERPALPKPNIRPVPKIDDATFSEPEPKLDDFADQADPYAAWLRAVSAFDRKKEAFEARQSHLKHQVETTHQGNREEIAKWEAERTADFSQRFKNFLLETQTSKEAMAAAIQSAEAMPSMEQAPALYWAILLGPNGPRHSFELAKNGELFDEFFEMAYGRPASQEFVEVLQRRLDRRIQAAQTGSAVPARETPPPAVVKPAPRPPNPVRTAPMKVSDGPPADDSSLSDHESAWPTRYRRR